MNLTLKRAPTVKQSTFGLLFVDEETEPLCWTLEDVIREQPGIPVAQWKVAGQTAIPAGRYRITAVNSPKFGPETLSVNDVPGFDLIRIHPGNDARDTEGCILVGVGKVPTADGGNLTESRLALAALKARVLPVLEVHADVWLTIQNP